MYASIIRTPDKILIEHEWGTEIRSDVVVETRVSSIDEEQRLYVYVTANETPLKYVRLRWMFDTEFEGRVLSDAWERGYGDMGFINLNPSLAMPWYFLIRQDDEMAGYGVRVRPNALCFWQADPKGITLWLDVRNGGEGVILGGRKVMLAEVVCQNYLVDTEMTGDEAFAEPQGIRVRHSFYAARHFCKRMCSDALTMPHAVYGSNNWYYAYGESSREEILADTDYLMSMTEACENPPYMVIDDCWQRDRVPEYIGGPWISNEKFGDMRSLMDEIKAKGARTGIWMRLLYDRNEDIPSEWRLASGYLDPSRPEVLAHITEDITRICSWGVELIKHDFSTFDIFGRWGFMMTPTMTEDGWHFHDRSRTSAEIVKELYTTILKAAEPTHTLILGCNTIGHLGAGLMHMHRVGDDTSGRIWERSLRMGVNTLAFRMPQHGIFFDIDADCLGIMESLPWKQNRLWGRLLAKSGTSLFVSPKPGVLTPEEKEELADFLRENSKQEGIAVPLDWETKPYPDTWQIGDEIIHFDWDYGDGIIGLQGMSRNWDFGFVQELAENRW